MTTIVSKRHLFKFYFSIILGTLFFVVTGTGLLVVYKDSANKGELKLKDKLIPIFSVACYAFAGYSFYRYSKNAPKVTLNKEFITFNNETYLLTDLKKVTLSGKKPFTYLIDFPMEAATLTFNNNETKYIFDDIYSNSWEIKSFLKQVVLEKRDFAETNVSIIDEDAVARDFYKTFKGNQFTSLRGITLWSVIGCFTFMMINSRRPNTSGVTIFVLCFSAFWLIAHSYLMHFFQVSDRFFLVRNHNFFWKKKAYNIGDIKEIVFETHGEMPNCLRIITKDFKNKLYPAATLTEKDWFALKDKLRDYKIKVRNECI